MIGLSQAKVKLYPPGTVVLSLDVFYQRVIFSILEGFYGWRNN